MPLFCHSSTLFSSIHTSAPPSHSLAVCAKCLRIPSIRRSAVLHVLGLRTRARRYSPHIPIYRRSFGIGYTSHHTGSASISPRDISLTKIAANDLNNTKAHGPVKSFYTPSKALIAALEAGGYDFAVPEQYTRKKDLSHVSPTLRKPPSRSVHTPQKRFREVDTGPRTDLQSVLALYMLRIHDLVGDFRQDEASSDSHLLRIFDEEALLLLESRGYDVQDVMSWAWIIAAKSSERAVSRLDVLYNKPWQRTNLLVDPVPVFVFMFLLRRPHVTASALRMLIKHANDWLLFASEKPCTSTSSTISEQTIMLLVVRLLRHARLVWPAAMESIVSILTTHVDGGKSCGHSPASQDLDETTSIRLSFMYNRILKLVALPSSQNPFLSVPYRQQAQFNVLRRMNQFRPHLTITREGYQAIASVQLAHRKTLREREWAEMKAKSWPPWKVDKLGIDSVKSIEMGVSRAMDALMRMYEAGYSRGNWEATAEILSGWDTDRSPTIQRRSVLLPSYRSFAITTANLDLNRWKESLDVWTARIRATRTLDESWACFLACRRELGAVPATVYFTMFESLVYDRRRKKEECSTQFCGNPNTHDFLDRLILPGDGKELAPAPTNPRDGIYLSAPPPNISDFFHTMVIEGHQPTGRFLAFLLNHAESFEEGLKYLEHSALSAKTKSVLLANASFSARTVRETLAALPKQVLAAYIYHLSSFGVILYSRQSSRRHFVDDDNHSGLAAKLDPLKQAHRLLHLARPLYRPTWYSLLHALSKITLKTYEEHFDPSDYLRDLSLWNLAESLVGYMDIADLKLDFFGFYLVCKTLEKTIRASQVVMSATQDPSKAAEARLDSQELQQDPEDLSREARLKAEALLTQGCALVKTLFKEACGTLRATTAPSQALNRANSLPNLLEVPAGVHLHAFIRVLGLAQDYAGILELMEWMSNYASAIKALSDEMTNGRRSLRRTLIAARIFLEGSWPGDVESEDEREQRSNTAAPEHIMQRVYTIIEETEQWDGWPTDEEVEEYCQIGKRL